MDVLLRILRFEEEKLRDHEVRDLVVHRAAQEDDAVAQQARVDVEGALAALALLDHVRDQGHAALRPDKVTDPATRSLTPSLTRTSKSPSSDP
jgi:hypothetical protein